MSIELAGHLDRVADAVAGLGRVDLTPARSPSDLQLLDRVGALQVGGDQQRLVALALEPAASFPASVVLPDPCRPASMMTVGGSLANCSRAGLAAEDVDQLLVDDLDDLLGRVERLGDLRAPARSLTRR